MPSLQNYSLVAFHRSWQSNNFCQYLLLQHFSLHGWNMHSPEVTWWLSSTCTFTHYLYVGHINLFSILNGDIYLTFRVLDSTKISVIVIIILHPARGSFWLINQGNHLNNHIRYNFFLSNLTEHIFMYCKFHRHWAALKFVTCLNSCPHPLRVRLGLAMWYY